MVEMKSFSIQFGTNATGKSTRVLLLIEYLISNYSYETIKATENGKTKELGILFPEIDTLILGKFTTSRKTGLKTWASLDYLLGAFGGVRDLESAILQYCNGKHVIAEGYLLDSYRFRPEHFRGHYNNQRWMSITYYYETREQYDERIWERSAQKIEGKTGWAYNGRMAKNFYAKLLEEKLETDVVHKELYTADRQYFGIKFLKFIGLDHEPFLDFVPEQVTLEDW